MVLGECGRLPLSIVYHTKCIKYWCKILQMPKSRYPQNCYNLLKSLDDLVRQTWASHVKELLFKFGFGFVWVSQDIGDINLSILQFKQRVHDIMTQNWCAYINNASRCSTYVNFKTFLNPEKYLSIAIPFNLRKSFACLRCSSHKINI